MENYNVPNQIAKINMIDIYYFNLINFNDKIKEQCLIWRLYLANQPKIHGAKEQTLDQKTGARNEEIHEMCKGR